LESQPVAKHEVRAGLPVEPIKLTDELDKTIRNQLQLHPNIK
jgi:hypothetical protein